jgi:amino acid transporter
MAVAGNAPSIFARCTKKGVPYYAVALSSSFGLLAYLNLISSGSTVFNWFANIVNTGGFQSWICCCFIYVRYRKAENAQNITNIPFRSRFQPYTVWVSGIGFSVLLLLGGLKVFIKGYWNTETFLTSYIGIVVFAVLYFGHKFTAGRNDKWAFAPDEVDLHSGLAEVISLETPAPPREKWYQKWKAVYE